MLLAYDLSYISGGRSPTLLGCHQSSSRRASSSRNSYEPNGAQARVTESEAGPSAFRCTREAPVSSSRMSYPRLDRDCARAPLAKAGPAGLAVARSYTRNIESI